MHSNHKLSITWIPDVLTVVDGTCRSEREVFRNVKTVKKAANIMSKRNKEKISFATYNNEVIYENIEEAIAEA